MDERIEDPNIILGDDEEKLRPRYLKEYIGQRDVKDNL